MYTPTAFAETRPDALHAFMRRHGFATLVTTGSTVSASHLPFLLDSGRGPLGALRGHMARENEQWSALETGAQVLVVFQGPHAYISPSWYKMAPGVPTWNYVAVHAYGKPKIMEDADTVRRILADTVETHEAHRPNPWSMESLPSAFVDEMQKRIVGFEIEITRMEAAFKLSQNRHAADRQRVIDALGQSHDAMDREIAGLMLKTLES